MTCPVLHLSAVYIVEESIDGEVSPLRVFQRGSQALLVSLLERYTHDFGRYPTVCIRLTSEPHKVTLQVHDPRSARLEVLALLGICCDLANRSCRYILSLEVVDKGLSKEISRRGRQCYVEVGGG